MENEMTIDKIVEKSKQWTLEGDCTLLQWMNKISNNLEERVTKTSSAINQMSIKLDRTSIALSNATNNLAALQYSKFVENRVHEDDETLANTTNAPSEDVVDNNNSGHDIYSFLKKNVEMMNSCHEAYFISYEDSDDDDEPVTSVVYRSKNPYELRPLPHIYGSNLWKEKWHIGLCDSDNDFSGEENSEQFSESSSTADDSYESTAPTMSEWDSTAWGLNTQHNVERKDTHTPSNDGESSYQGEEFSQSKVSTPRTQRHIPVPITQQPIQDQRYYQHVPRRQENLFDDIFDSSKSQEETNQVVASQATTIPQTMPVPQKKIVPESYIPNEPPPDDQSIDNESNRRVGAKKTLNLFDDDEFSSFMDQIVQKATNKNIKSDEKPQENIEPPEKSVAPNLFNDHEDHGPSDADAQKQTKKNLDPNLFAESNVQKDKKQPIKTLPPNLFSDSDDLLFIPASEKSQGPSKKIIAPNLFSDSDDLFASSSNEHAILNKKQSSSKLEDDIFTSSHQTETIIGKTKIKNLFDDDEEDDDFDNIFSSKPSNSFSQATKNIFSDDLTVEQENTEPIKQVPKSNTGLLKDEKNILASSENESANAPLFKEVSIVEKSVFIDDVSLAAEKEIIFATPILEEDTFKEGSLLKKGLFDDFDDLEDDNDLFSTKPVKENAFDNLFGKEKSDNELSIHQKTTLLGDEGETEDSKEIASMRSELGEEIDKNKPSNAQLDNTFAPSPSKNKTQVDDIFADNVDDDFENVSINSSKPNKVNEEYSKLPAISTKPVTASIPIESPIKPATTSRLPIIAQKPSVKKMLKPQVMPKKPLKPNVSEKTYDGNGLSNTATKDEAGKISAIHSEDPRQNLEQLNDQLPETSKARINSISKLHSTLHMNVSEPSTDVVTEIEQDKDQQSFIEEKHIEAGESLKPIAKRKPTVTIEHDNISSPSKEIADEKSLVDQSAKKTSTIPSYISLFHDDIPPEDENPNPNSNEESPLHTVEEDVDVKPISSAPSVPYNSLNLFADVPPDDYFTVSIPPAVEKQTKRIHSIFYDDFSETIEAGREMRTPPSYMINDEPPPDDKDNKPVISEIKKEKPQVSKLKKMNFQINVGALLPSAKLPSFKKSETVEKSQSDILIKDQITPSEQSENVPNQLPSEKSRELPEHILPNLNKARAKVQVKRRPSTRMGRQDMYRKSMIEDAVSIDNQEENETEIQKPMPSSHRKDFETETQENYNDNKDNNEIEEELKTPILSLPFDHSGAFNKNQEINKEPQSKMTDEATLFEESDNLFNKNVNFSKVATTSIPSLLKNSDSEAENIFETIKPVKSYTKESEVTKNLDSLFDSDGIDENPFGTPKNFVTNSTTSKETNKPPEQKSKLDLLFESVQPQHNVSKYQPGTLSFKQSAEPTKTTPKSLFGDSDDGSDELFKEAIGPKKTVNKPKTKTITKQAKPSASLFSSDEDSASGDDIFKKAKSKTATKKNERVNDKAPSSLFADLSDDDSDGLFGTSTKKAIGVNKAKTNPPKNRLHTPKQPAQLQQAKSVSSNPLSDLLGP